jgi:O-antigen ligase
MYWVSNLYSPEIIDAVTEAVKISCLVFAYLLIYNESFTNKLQILKGLIVTNTVVVVVGILFQLYREGRLQSVVEYANVLAIVLLITASASLILYVKSNKWTDFIHFVIQVSGILLTMTRAVWVLWIVLMIVFVIGYQLYRNQKAIAVLVGGHFAAFLLAGMVKGNFLFILERAEKISAKASEFQIRLQYWGDAFQMIGDHPWFGVGAGGWKSLQQLYQQDYYVSYVHNGYLQIALDIGLVGLALAIAAVFVIIWQAIQTRHEMDAEQRTWMIWVSAIGCMVFIHIGFDFDMNFAMFTAIIGFLLAFAQPSRNREA